MSPGDRRDGRQAVLRGTRGPDESLGSREFDWLASAQCRGADLDLFFPVGNGTASGWTDVEAKEICAVCPVIDDCREWALRVKPGFGIFGGLTPEERRRPRRPRLPRGASSGSGRS